MNKLVTKDVIRKAVADAPVSSGEFGRGLTRAAVLIPVISENGQTELLFTLRTDQVEHHKNQISFPGGVADVTDRSAVETALRETREELGIADRLVEVVGEIDKVVTPSGFLITPVVGVLNGMPRLELNAAEVKEAFTVPIRYFLETGNLRTEYRQVRGEQVEVYFYDYGKRMIWGVTAHIIRNFLLTVAAVLNE